MTALPFLPAPLRPRRHRRVALDTRAANVRKWLAFGPVPLASLARDMQCTRYALWHTLRTMPDVRVTYGARRVATVSLGGVAVREAA